MSIEWTGEVGNFPDDFVSENGCYENDCFICHKHFFGHKGRIACRICEDSMTKNAKSLEPWQLEGLNEFTMKELRS